MHPRGIRGVADERGVTLVELLIAAVILFIAVTAVFALILKSLDMSIQSKQQNIAVSAGSSYIEQVRALPYDSIGVIGAVPPSIPGSLSVSTSTTVSGYSVVITPDVRWQADPNIGLQAYKSITVTITVDAPGVDRPIVKVVRTFIRRAEVMGSPGSGVPGALTIRFDTGMPARGTFIQNTVDVPFTAANSNVNVTVKGVEIIATRTGTGYSEQLTRPDGSEASWGNLEQNPFQLTFPWDTTHVDTETMSPAFPDGRYDLDAVAQDSVGNISHALWYLVIDNDAPVAVPVPTGYSYRSNLVRFNWSDGIAYAEGIDAYTTGVQVYRDVGTSPGGAPWDSMVGWEGLSPTSVGAGRDYYDLISAPFTRYTAFVTPYNYFGKTPGSSYMAGPVISRPGLTGVSTVTYSNPNKDWTTTTNLTMGPPQFAQSALTFELYRNTSASSTGQQLLQTWTTLQPSYTYTDTYTSGDNRPRPPIPPTRYYYRMVCRITPTGWGGGTQQTLYSAWVGPSPADVANNVTLGETW